MKHSSATRGGELPYTSPSMELLELPIEQGFANSTATGDWDNSLDNNLNWGGGSDFNEFE